MHLRPLSSFWGEVHYGQTSGVRAAKSSRTKMTQVLKTAHRERTGPDTDRGDKPNLAEIVNLIKNCDEAEAIESQILDRTSQVNRILLPLFIVYKHQGNAFGLTSGDINKITIDLGIPIQTANVSHTLAGTASRYVIGDAVRERGKVIRYKLSRRGVQHFTSVLKATADDK